MASITAPTYDPTTTAQALAQKTTAAIQQQITDQTNAATATSKALTTLKSAISAFQSSLGSLTGVGKSMLAQSATLSNTSVGSASAQATAAAGSYNLFVKQVATAGQVSYNVGADATIGGSLNIQLAPPSSPVTTPPSPGTASGQFTVNLNTAADTDKDGKLSLREIAAAINSEPTNAGKVSAGVVTLNGTAQLVLTSKSTGEANNVWVGTGAGTDAALAGSLDLSKRNVTVKAQDAIVLFNATSSTTGTEVKQASNTFTNIDGVSLTVTQAQAATDQPFTLAVAGNNSGTTSNVQAFVDAYNKLKSAVDGLVDLGDPTAGTKGGTFAHDAGVRALQSRLVSMVRATGSPSLASYGITAARDGTLSLDSTRLTKQLAVNPTGLDTLIGSASKSSPSGVAGALDTYLTTWSDSAKGQLQQRTDATSKLQKDLAKRQTELDAKYDAAYQRYLKQYSQLQTLQSSMNNNVSMFDAMFSNDKS